MKGEINYCELPAMCDVLDHLGSRCEGEDTPTFSFFFSSFSAFRVSRGRGGGGLCMGYACPSFREPSFVFIPDPR